MPLLTAMGYDFVPGALAGALALEEAGEAAVRVDVGYYALGMAAQSGSAGTRASLVGATLDEGHAFRDGELEHGADGASACARSPSRTASGRRSRSAAPSTSALPAAYPRLREVNVYLGWFGPLARPMQAGALVGSVATRLPGVREALRVAGERLVALAEGPEAGTTPGGESRIAGAGLRRGRRAARRGRSCAAATGTRSPPTSSPGRRAPRAPGGSRAPARSARWRRSGSTSSSAAAPPPGSAA